MSSVFYKVGMTRIVNEYYNPIGEVPMRPSNKYRSNLRKGRRALKELSRKRDELLQTSKVTKTKWRIICDFFRVGNR